VPVVVALLVSLALLSNVAVILQVSAVNGIKADAWTDKGNNDQLPLPWGCVGCYRIGEQVTIYYSVNVDCQAKLTLRKPDSSETALFEGSLKAGTYSKAASAGHPTGYRDINFEAWVGDKKASDTFSFCVVHDYVKFRGKVSAFLPTYGGGDFWKIEVGEVLLDPTTKIQGIMWVHWQYSLAQISRDIKEGDYVEIFGGYVGKYQMGASEGEFVCLGNKEHYIRKAQGLIVVGLGSETTDGKKNVGAIVFGGVEYKLPGYVRLELKDLNKWHSIVAKPPSGYIFVRWEHGGRVEEIRDLYSQSTEAYVEGIGQIKAWFKAQDADYRFEGDVLAFGYGDYTIKIKRVLHDPRKLFKEGDTVIIPVYKNGKVIGDVKVGSYVEVYGEYGYGVHQSYHYIKKMPESGFVVHLLSAATDGKTNIGSITFNNIDYNLPGQVTVSPNKWYPVRANPPIGYDFDHWEIGGGVTGIRDPKAKSTEVYVEDAGSLKAWFRFTHPFDFKISAEPPSRNVKYFESANYLVTVSHVSGPVQTVLLSVPELPGHLQYSFSQSSGMPTFTSTLTVTITRSTPPGKHSITIAGSGGGITRSTTVTLNVGELRLSILSVGQLGFLEVEKNNGIIVAVRDAEDRPITNAVVRATLVAPPGITCPPTCPTIEPEIAVNLGDGQYRFSVFMKLSAASYCVFLVGILLKATTPLGEQGELDGYLLSMDYNRTFSPSIMTCGGGLKPNEVIRGDTADPRIPVLVSGTKLVAFRYDPVTAKGTVRFLVLDPLTGLVPSRKVYEDAVLAAWEARSARELGVLDDLNQRISLFNDFLFWEAIASEIVLPIRNTAAKLLGQMLLLVIAGELVGVQILTYTQEMARNILSISTKEVVKSIVMKQLKPEAVIRDWARIMVSIGAMCLTDAVSLIKLHTDRTWTADDAKLLIVVREAGFYYGRAGIGILRDLMPDPSFQGQFLAIIRNLVEGATETVQSGKPIDVFLDGYKAGESIQKIHEALSGFMAKGQYDFYLSIEPIRARIDASLPIYERYSTCKEPLLRLTSLTGVSLGTLADLHVYSKDGKHVGLNATRFPETEIEGSIFFKTNVTTVILVPADLAEFSMVVVSYGVKELFTLSLTIYDKGNVKSSESIQETIQPGERQVHHAFVVPEEGRVWIDAPWYVNLWFRQRTYVNAVAICFGLVAIITYMHQRRRRTPRIT